MKPSISSSGVSISGSVGGQKGTVGVGSNGTVSLGIDTAGIKLGITNDYGGAGTIGFGGQSITLGTEGGNIKLGIGGFEVFVEARNCIVVETKKIAGMIVSRRSYPDPGCKQPATQVLPSPIAPDKKLPTAIRCSTGRWIVGGWGRAFDQSTQRYGPLIFHEGYEYIKEIALFQKLVSVYNDGSNFNSDQLKDPEKAAEALADRNYGKGNWSTQEVIYQGYFYNNQYNWNPGAGDPEGFVGYWYWNGVGASLNAIKNWTPYTLRGAIKAKWIFKRKRYLQKGWTPDQTWWWWGSFLGIEYGLDFNIEEIVPPPPCPIGSPFDTPGGLSLLIPPPSAGNRPPMSESCCESLKADIEDIKEVLATKEILAGKLTFPWRLRMPGGQGEEKIYDYPNLARCIAQMIDHLGIHPPKLSIKDINNAVAGDQSIENQFPSGTQAFEALMAQVWDANADVDTLTNFLYRLSWLCVQQSMNLARVSGDIQCIKDMFGGETEPQESSITTPFNIGAGVEEKTAPKGKGFGKSPGGNIDKSIEANTELSTEKLLPDFLKIRENPVIVQTFTGNKDVFDLLSIIILKLEGLQNR